MADIRLATGGEDIKLWDCNGYVLGKHLNPHKDGTISSLFWGHDNYFLASASTGGDKIVLTYAKSLAYNTSEVAVGEGRTCAALSSVSRYLLTGGKDGSLQIWDLRSKKLKKTYRDHKKPVTCLSFNYNDTYTASGSEMGHIILHNVVTGQSSSPLIAPEAQAIRRLQYSYFKKSLLGSVSDDGAVNLWDVNTRRLLHSFSDTHRVPATDLAFSPFNESLMMSVGLDKKLFIYDVQGKSIVKTVSLDNPLTSVDIMYDGVTVGVGTTRGAVHIFDLRQGTTPVRLMNAHQSSVQCLAFQNNFKANKVDGSAKTASPRVAKTTQQSLAQKAASSAGKPSKGEAQTKLIDKTNLTKTPDARVQQSEVEENVFSPLRGGDTNTANSENGRYSDVLSENRPDILGMASSNRRSGMYNDGVFSPLADGSTNESGSRRHPIGAGSFNDSMFLGNRPITAGIGSESSHRKPNSFHLGNEVTSSTGYTPSSQPSHAVNSVHTPSNVHATDAVQASPRLENKRKPGFVDKIEHEDVKSLPSPRPVSLTNSAGRDPVVTTKSKVSPRSEFTPREPEHSVNDAGDWTAPGQTRKSPRSQTGVSSIMGGAEGASSGTTPLTTPQGAVGGMQPFHTEFIRNVVEDALEEFRDQMHREHVHLQMEMVRQFQIQLNEVRSLLQEYSVNRDLVAEVQRLRDENAMLKKKF